MWKGLQNISLLLLDKQNLVTVGKLLGKYSVFTCIAQAKSLQIDNSLPTYTYRYLLKLLGTNIQDKVQNK